MYNIYFGIGVEIRKWNFLFFPAKPARSVGAAGIQTGCMRKKIVTDRPTDRKKHTPPFVGAQFQKMVIFLYRFKLCYFLISSCFSVSYDLWVLTNLNPNTYHLDEHYVKEIKVLMLLFPLFKIYIPEKQALVKLY